MSGAGLGAVAGAVARHGAVARVLVLSVEGSVPRGPGTAMLVWANGQTGTIGGGALEWEAAAAARQVLARGEPWAREERRMPLGPSLGQCCGGAVRLLIERFGAEEVAALTPLPTAFARPMTSGAPDPSAEMPFEVARALRRGRSAAAPGGLVIAEGWVLEPVEPPLRPLWLYGAGHVGRAVVRVLDGLPFAVTWIDDAPARFPAEIPDHATRLIASNPADAVAHAPPDAVHIVMTYSHALDLEICHRVLSRPHAHLGLIGSATKAARFRSRLKALGHGEGAIAGLHCPIGDRRLGKAPAAIAIGLAAELLALPEVAAAVEEAQA
ncbi:MAG: xanthine dehydrogenase accessory protein XdhC [Pseudomonadota bacterium]